MNSNQSIVSNVLVEWILDISKNIGNKKSGFYTALVLRVFPKETSRMFSFTPTTFCNTGFRNSSFS